MKTYEEITSRLLERRDRYVTEKQRKRKAIACAALSTGCVGMIALISLGIWQLNTTAPLPSVTPNEPATQTDKSQNDQGTAASSTPDQNDPVRIAWVINNVEATAGCAKLYYSPETHYSEGKTANELAQYFGKDYASLADKLPKGFQLYTQHQNVFFYKNDGTLVYDTSAYSYHHNDQEITIKVSKLGQPYDYLYRMEDSVASHLEGLDVILGGFRDDANEGYSVVFADFSYGEQHFRITVENLPFSTKESDPVMVIKGIIKEITN